MSQTSLVDTDGVSVSNSYDSAGNLTSIDYGGGHSKTFTYNTNGTLASATDLNGKVTTYSYSSGNLVSINPPSPLGSTTYTRDSLGRTSTVTDGNGNVTTMTYNALDRIVSESTSSGVVSYTYDGDGNILSMTDGTGTSTYTYDGVGRQVTKSAPMRVPITYAYDDGDNFVGLTDAGGHVAYGYNAAGQLTSITDPQGLVTTFTYDSNGNQTQINYPNNVRITKTYDSLDRQISFTARNMTNNALIDERNYSYLGSGGSPRNKLQSVSASNPLDSATYQYTSRFGRLAAATVGTNSYSYTYDNNGNRLSATRNGVTTTMAYNNAGQLVSANGGAYTFANDASGNQVSDSLGRSFGYNAFNLPTSHTPPGETAVSMTYSGPDATLLQAWGAWSISNHMLGVGSSQFGSAVTAYTRGLDGQLLGIRDYSGSKFYPISDPLGSVLKLTDASRNVVNSYRYDPYGQIESKTEAFFNPIRFAGGISDITNTPLIKYGGRYYNPQQGRWTQADPLFSETDSADTNRYAYAGNDPVNQSDPSGFYPVPQCAIRPIPKPVRSGRKSVYGYAQQFCQATVSAQDLWAWVQRSIRGGGVSNYGSGYVHRNSGGWITAHAYGNCDRGSHAYRVKAAGHARLRGVLYASPSVFSGWELIACV